jgi:hypothetical protein
VADETGVILPPGVTREAPRADRAIVVNETDLPDDVVTSYVAEHASLFGVGVGRGGTEYSSYNYPQQGSMLARTKYRAPANVIEEVCLARDLAERDDDVAAAMGTMLGVAFGDGMAHTHPDEVTVAVFDELAKHANFDALWLELYREWLIAAQVVTATVWEREAFQFTPDGADRQRTRSVVAPMVGVLPAENIRCVGSDLFGTATLALKPATSAQDRWLEEYLSDDTTAGRKAEMRAQDPVLAALVIRKIESEDSYSNSFVSEFEDPYHGGNLYALNPRLVARVTAAKGAWSYPRPYLTRDFALLEAKRLLNIMDWALLQGGSNFLVIAKKGSDQKPALQPEIDNLHEVIRTASRTGVIIGDHRLQVEVVTPKLDELLNPAKRNLIGRKLANAILRVPEQEEDAGGEGMKTRVEFISRVLMSDRRLLKRHVERTIYVEAAKRNSTIGQAPTIWFPKIILAGTNYFTDYVLKLRDRSDISRTTAVQVAGFDYEAEVRQRRAEKPDDRIMAPAAVPFSSPNMGPQDNQQGRPPGPNRNGQPADPARPRQVVTRNQGETVTARFDDETGSYRVGELTERLLAQYPGAEIGRITAFERAALGTLDEEHAVIQDGALTVVPVNEPEQLYEIRAVRLAEGLSLLVGYTDDDALLARAFVFRQPEFNETAAQALVASCGWEPPPWPRPEQEEEPVPGEFGASNPGQPIEVHVHAPDGAVKAKRIVRDEQGNITEIRSVSDADT